MSLLFFPLETPGRKYFSPYDFSLVGVGYVTFHSTHQIAVCGGVWGVYLHLQMLTCVCTLE